jgi:hypothetical protein
VLEDPDLDASVKGYVSTILKAPQHTSPLLLPSVRNPPAGYSVLPIRVTPSGRCALPPPPAPPAHPLLADLQLASVNITVGACLSLLAMNESIVTAGEVAGHRSEFQGGGKGKKRKVEKKGERSKNWGSFKQLLASHESKYVREPLQRTERESGSRAGCEGFLRAGGLPPTSPTCDPLSPASSLREDAPLLVVDGRAFCGTRLFCAPQNAPFCAPQEDAPFAHPEGAPQKGARAAEGRAFFALASLALA